jgi:hypothetical protein
MARSNLAIQHAWQIGLSSFLLSADFQGQLNDFLVVISETDFDFSSLLDKTEGSLIGGYSNWYDF